MSTTDKIALISAVIAVLAAVVAIVSTLIARAQYKVAQSQFTLDKQVYVDAHEQSRREMALSVSSQYDEKTLDARAEILSRWKELFDKNGVIPWDEIEQVRKEQIAARNTITPHSLVVTDQLQKILNFFEMVALAVNGEVANEKILRECFCSTMTRWHTLTTEFRNHLTTTRGYNPWIPLDDLVEKWKPGKKPVSLPPLGKI